MLAILGEEQTNHHHCHEDGWINYRPIGVQPKGNQRMLMYFTIPGVYLMWPQVHADALVWIALGMKGQIKQLHGAGVSV